MNGQGERSPRIRSKALFGGPFGTAGRYSIATVPCLERGLHAVQHMVVDPGSGRVLAVDTDKRQALEAARRLLRAVEDADGQGCDGRPLQASLWPAAELPVPSGSETAPRRATRRRREVFERSRGMCHYCRAPLQLLGPWHVEHMMPRALGGSDEAVNLVAACVRCNLRKADRSAIEFVAKESQ